MIVTRKYEITDTTLIYASVPEDDAPAYDPAATYAQGDRVIYAHKIYEALTSVSGVTPDSDPVSWLEIGATNRWRMFDGKVGTQTEYSGTITVHITSAQPISMLALMQLTADAVVVRVKDADGLIVYDKTFSLRDYGAADWFDYFFGEDGKQTGLIIPDLPPFANVTLEVDIQPTGTTAACGMFIHGEAHDIGSANYGLSLSIHDYSKKTADTFGNYTFVERGYANLCDVQLDVPTEQIGRVHDVLASLRATPALYVAEPSKPETAVYGIARNFSLIMANPVISKCNLKLEGLI